MEGVFDRFPSHRDRFLTKKIKRNSTFDISTPECVLMRDAKQLTKGADSVPQAQKSLNAF